ncbi:MAG: transposase [Candidatus Binatia bacterium]
MARPLRLEFAGALYHLTSRGNRQESIFLDNGDRRSFLDLLGKEVKQQGWVCYASCLMDNRYHLIIETPEPNLVRGMRRLNGVYTQAFNRRHEKVGHLFQGRYKAIVVDKESYLFELCRYVVLNPVRAKVVPRPEDWKWSSYRGTAGMIKGPEWLAVEKVVSFFSGQQANYQKFVAEGIAKPSVWQGLKGQIYLGGEGFLKCMQNLVEGKAVHGISRAQTKPLCPGADEMVATVARAYGILASRVLDRSHVEAYWLAVYLMRRVGNLSLQEVAERVGVSAARISQIQTKIEQGQTSAKMTPVLRWYKLKD